MQWLLSLMRFKPVTVLLHIALVTIVVGACVTHFVGEQGEVHLRYDGTTSLKTRHATLSLFLWDFQVMYDGDNNPADFISELRILDRSRVPLHVDEGTIRMNKPLKYHGFRFCQADYDSDQRGVVLRYNYDPWGIGITYTGYALLLVAMIGFFFQKHTRFRSLVRKQHAWLLAGIGIAAVVLAVVMTKVVTPKPPLQPVLQTPLLGIHVSVIMLAYTLFAIIMLNGILGLCNKKLSPFTFHLSLFTFHLSSLLLYPALFCLTAGIFIGAVWANMSWGRYWGWDPKEKWALITMLVYAALLHYPWIQKWLGIRKHAERIFHICSIVAFFFVLFTYFGVSYLLGGLHSYAN